MKVIKTIGLLVVACGLLAAGYFAHEYFPRNGRIPPRDRNKTSVSIREIKAQGRLEPASGTLTISALPGEEIAELRVHVGRSVKKGDELAVLASRALRQEETELARTRVVQAEAQLVSQKELAALRQQAADLAVKAAQEEQDVFRAQEKAISVGQARRELAQHQLEKLTALRGEAATRDAITEAETRQQELLIEQLNAEIQQNEAKLGSAKKSQQTAQDAAALDKMIADKTLETLEPLSPLTVLKKSVELAEAAEQASVVRAPCDGQILEIFVREGERISKSPILQMGDLNRIVCVAEVHEAKIQELECDETDDGRLAPKRDYRVTITSSAFREDPPGTRQLTGKVIEVGRLIGTPELREPSPLATADVRSAKVRIELDRKSAEQARRFIHLQVDVTIHLDKDAASEDGPATDAPPPPTE
ncbi:MAG: hypothetical protein FJ276_23125 [Planctomycetes bacterium]|nr:hypothetical protein [Planctomycetota bacterium]